MRTDSGAREERQLLWSLVEAMPAIAWTTDRELRFTSSVGGGLADLGLSPGEVVGRTLHDYLGTSDPEMAAIAAHEAALQGRSTRYEQNWQGRRYASHVVPLRDDEGTVVGAAGVSLDVTERVWEPGALFEAETKYQGLVETIPAVTYIDPLDEWSDSIYVSPQVNELLGYTPEEWLTDSGFWRDHVHPGDADRAWQEWVRARDSGSPYQSEYRMLHRDGHVVWVSERAVILKDSAGRPWAVQGVMVDITERKRVEEELERAWQREREAAAHLRDLDDMKNLLLHAVAHDLRGPIATVLGSAMVLENSLIDLDEDKRDLIRGVGAGARKLNRLVNDLLDLERLERGLVEPDRRPTDVGELARRVVAELKVQFHEVHVETETSMSPVDPVHVERIVENLLVNAARHTPKGTPIWVRVNRAEDGTTILVEDAGPGVPPDLREVIFEPFRHGGEGLGIGLSLVARFATLHGGWARVGDREGGGASFEVFLPDGPVVDETVPETVELAAP
jgi:PAS domain S-box-containing protein